MKGTAREVPGRGPRGISNDYMWKASRTLLEQLWRHAGLIWPSLAIGFFARMSALNPKI